MRFVPGVLAIPLVTGCFVTPAASQGQGPVAPVNPTPSELPMPSQPVGDSDLRPYNGPITCSGADDLSIENADINVNGPGLTVTGSCSIYLRNSRLVTHGGPAVMIAGSGDIEISQSYVAGQPSLIVSGSGTITVKQSQIDGDLIVSGSGTIEISGNAIRGRQSITGSGEILDRDNQWQ